VATGLVGQRCESCGLTRHLRTDDEGHTLCLDCRQPRSGFHSTSSIPAALPLAAANDGNPLAILMAEHELIGRVAEALKVFAGNIKAEYGSYGRHDLAAFVRVFRDLADYVHHEKEEHLLLPMLGRHGFDWNHGPLAESRREHRQERYLTEVLNQFAVREHRWDAEERRRVVSTAMALGDFQREHLAKENELLFAAVPVCLDLKQQQRLKSELEAFDRQVQRYVPLADLRTLAQGLIQRYGKPAPSVRVAAAV
jgi:hemerythrin-like domain-containing protein